jgi:hypothetical protein
MRDIHRPLRLWLVMPALLVALCIALTAPAFSQTITTGDVAGVIKDATGAVVPNATITLKSSDTGEVRTAVTGPSGDYRFPLLKPGEYTISAQASGLKSNVEKFSVLVGQAGEMNLTLSVTASQQVIEVQAEAPTLQTENANLESNFNKSQVDNLPMPGGDLTTLAMTAPGIRVNVTGGSGNMNANGIPGSTILYTLDGMDQNDPANNLNNSGASNNLLGANGVGEVAIVLNAYSPEYGRMAGAQVNMVGISGANQFHGNLFYNFNFEKLNANSFFANSAGTRRPRSDAHQFGGRIGGPVWKNKIFFFFDTENLRYVLPSSGVISLPSPELQAYTLAHVNAAQLPLYQDYFNLVKGAPGLNRAIPVTNGSGQLQDGKGHLGCGINTFYKTPTGTGGIFGVDTPCAVALFTDNTEINTEQLFNGRGDANISATQKLSIRYFHDAGVQATGTSPINPLYNSVSHQPSYQVSLSHTWVATPTIVNTLNASVLWYTALFGVDQFTKTQALMPDSIAIGEGGANGGGFATIGAGAFPNGRNVGHFQVNDDFSWTRGTHTFKAGVNARYDQYTYTSIASGAFLGAYSLGDLSDFANGKLGFNGNTLSSFTQSFPLYGALHFRFPSADFYLGDEWAVTKNLKLTYGLRIEENFNPTCVEKCFILTNVPFNSTSYQATVNTPYNTTLTQQSNLFYNGEGPIVQPRIGFAYKPPFAHDKTVIRGGIGLFATNYTDGLGGTLANQVPNKFAPSGLNFGSVGLITDPTSSAYTAQLSSNAFQSGFNAGYTLAQIQNAVKPATFSTPSISSFPSTFHAPHTLEWSFEIQREIDNHNMFTVSYVGNHAYDLQETVNANMFASTTGTYFKAPYNIVYGGLPTAAPDPRFVSVTQYYTTGISNYNSLTLQYRHSFSWGLTGQVHYTWSHALGDNAAYQNPFNLSNAYGSLGFDNRHQVAGDVLWTQPIKASNKVVNHLIAGWTVGAKLFVFSGAPFSVTDSKIASSVNASGVLTPIADLVDPTVFGKSCNKSNAIGQACLSTTSFASYPGEFATGTGTPLQIDWGNTSPNSFRGPGYFDLDTTLQRSFTIKEKYKFVFGIQAYNVLNHANFANPSGTLTSGAFGTITSTLGPPTSIYGTGQGASVSGRLAVLTGTFSF